MTRSTSVRSGGSQRPLAPDYAVHPGETILEWLEEARMTQAELARRIGMSAKALNQMVRGHVPVTHDTSLRLESVTAIPARVWNNLQSVFDEDAARLRRNHELASHRAFLDLLPIADLRRLGHVTERMTNPASVIEQVCRFFAVSDPAAWHRQWTAPGAAFRQSPTFAAQPGAIATWLRLGEIAAAEIDVRPFDRKRLQAALPRLRGLSLEPDLRKAWRGIQTACANAGVAAVMVSPVKGAPCWGASYWMRGNPVIQVSLRHRSDDQLWFTLMHEIGHVLLHGKRAVFLDGDSNAPGSLDSAQEADADDFARDTLIPPVAAVRLPGLRALEDVRRFAAGIGISPGIVVGRLQHDGYFSPATGNKLKRWYPAD